jgi:UDPglucose 6-dehydrogenase
MEKAKLELPEITYCQNHYEAAQQADAVLVLTEWDEFRDLDWVRLADSVAHALLIDGRNLYSADEAAAHGFQYLGIGKEPGAAQPTHKQAAAKRLAPRPSFKPVSHQVAPAQSVP